MTTSPEIYQKWDTYRTLCGGGRIEYHPDWSPELPWASYVGGTARMHFAQPSHAATYFMKNWGMQLDLTKKG